MRGQGKIEPRELETKCTADKLKALSIMWAVNSLFYQVDMLKFHKKVKLEVCGSVVQVPVWDVCIIY